MTAPLVATTINPPPAAWSGYGNGSFRVWPQGPGPHVLAPGEQRYVAGLWRVVAGHDPASGPAVTARQLNPVEGGIELVIDWTAADQVVYLRQLAYDLTRFAGEVFTPTHAVWSDTPKRLDYYARARWNADDAQRLPVVDTPLLDLPAGSHVVHTTMTVPAMTDPGAAGWALTDRNALEVSLRFWSTGAGRQVIRMRDVAMPAGVSPSLPAMASIDDDIADVSVFEESGHYEVTGWSDVKGQKRCWIDYAGKAFDLGAGHILLRDQAGTAGRVTTYDRNGARTDGVIPYAISGSPGMGRRMGFGVLLRDSYAAGVSFDWYARNYGEGEWVTW